MRGIKSWAMVTLAGLLMLIAMGSEAWAREVITVTKANGGSYNITAYRPSTKTHYFITGNLDSDSRQIIVPYGYACTITVTLGRAVGDRNLYEKQDPLNPIFEVRKKSTYLLELVRTGTGYSTNAVQGNSVLPGIGGGDFQRQPPPGQ